MHPSLRGLTHFRKASLAVALGAAVASTVLTGALLTGDSVRGSLRDLTLERLGGIDQALVSSRFFREELAADLKAAPLIVLRGTAVHGETGARAAGVAIYGIDARFTELHEAERTVLIAVTHSLDLAARFARRCELAEGRCTQVSEA